MNQSVPKGSPGRPRTLLVKYPNRGEPQDCPPGYKPCLWCGQPYKIQQYGRRRVCSLPCRKARLRDSLLREKYGIDLAEYNNMFIRQEGRCALCQRKSKLSLAVEHSHITGTIRGLCCMTCNRDIIGPLDGSTEKFDKAIAFLQRARDDLARYLEGLPEPRLSEVPPVETTGRTLVPVHYRKT